MTISRTLSEITATTTKAVRGAGCHWGLAEETGQAVRELERHGLPGVRAVAQLLSAKRSCTCTGTGGAARCGIRALASIADRMHLLDRGEVLKFDNVVVPLLILGPLLAAARRSGKCYRLDVGEGSISATPSGVVGDVSAIQPAPEAGPVEIRMETKVAGTVVSPDQSARQVGPADWAVLEKYAYKTLVPETEESRMRGAGSGESRDE